MNASKATWKDLAICGGAPAFSKHLHVNRPNLGERERFLQYVNTSLDSYWFTNDGPLVNELEERLARFLGVKFCIAACNGTSALGMLVHALDLQGEVIIPSFSFISTAHALSSHGITPVFCDINPNTWNLDPTQCETLITNRTTAIIGAHLWGRPCDISRLEKIAARHGLHLLFDAAHAFGCTHEGKMIGCFGTAEVFSFHATKVFHTFEGGAVTTNDPGLAAHLRSVRNFGFTAYDQVETIGINAKMPEVSAAMGLTNLQSIDHFIDENRSTYERYKQGLKNIPGVQLLPYSSNERNNFQYIVIEVDKNNTGLTRDQLIEILHAENVLARRYYYPGNHRMEPYRSRFLEVDQRLSNTNFIAERVLVLPGGTGVTESQIGQICSILRIAEADAPAIRPILESMIKKEPDAISKASFSASLNKNAKKELPTVEFRIPISANEKSLRMLHYLLASLQEFGGPIGRSAHCIVSVSADEPQRDLVQECSWASEYSVEFQWLDQDLFGQWEYDGTGLHRLKVPSSADIIILADADLLVAGDFDKVILEAYNTQHLLGCIAHLSPFDIPALRHIPSFRWWNWIFEQAGLPKAVLKRSHTGWGLQSHNVMHRSCPDYFNYGFIISPREYIEKMGETFIKELEAVEQVVETWYKSQIANTLTFVRHGIPCKPLPVNYNFPLHIPGDKFRALNPDPEGANSPEDIKIFHYLGKGREINREHFATRRSLEKFLRKRNLSETASVFKRKLQIVHNKITKG